MLLTGWMGNLFWEIDMETTGRRTFLKSSVASLGAGALRANVMRFAAAFTAMAQLGTETAVILYFARDIGRIISSSLHIENVYGLFAEEVHKLIPFDRIVIGLVNSQEGTVNAAYVAGTEIAERRKGAILTMGGTATEEMMQTGLARRG